MGDTIERQAMELFKSALDIPASERTRYLDRACSGQVRQRVAELLAAHMSAGRFLARPTGGSTRRFDAREKPGDVIGNYKLLQEVGEGGFGVVWVAQQQKPVRRRVALKIIKLGMDTEQVIARFEAERQALAIMDHPNIAKVFDAGATETGRPYFVMELVKGVAITTYCDEVRLPAAERLMLFTDVCHAVQHAHHKGVIHRDLKPSNILVTLHDGRPVPKVIDFGIAKATDQRLTERTVFTEFRQMIGTPEYMAPEQAELSALDVDTRADIYSLGVVLYELLTGTRPFDLTALLEKGYEEILRTIREEEPVRPSTRVSTMGDELAAVARNRHTPPRFLGRLLRGDLDWIVMKALEKDRTRRYETPDSLARDIRRFLDDEPVEASPPTRMYRLRKYVRRHRLGVVASAAVFVALATGGAVAFAGLLEARAQRDLAAASATQARDAAERATKEADRANMTFSLTRRMIRAANPWDAAHDVTLREMLDSFEKELPDLVEGYPGVEATIRELMADAYMGLDLDDRARVHIDRTLEIWHDEVGESHWLFANALASRGRWLFLAGRLEEAEQDQRRALAIHRACHGNDHPGVSAILGRLSQTVRTRGRFPEAVELAREALEVSQELGLRSEVAHNRLNLAEAMAEAGRGEEAVAVAQEGLAELRAIFGERHLHVAIGLGGLANALRVAGRPGEALARRLEACAIEEEILGKEHPLLASTLTSISVSLSDLDRLDEAEEYARRAVALSDAFSDDADPTAATALSNLGAALELQGKHAEAAEIFRRAVELSETRTGGELDGHGNYLNNLATSLWALGQEEEAFRMKREALSWYRAHGGEEHETVADIILGLGCWQLEKGDLGSATARFEEANAVYRRVVGEAHEKVAWSLYWMGQVAAHQSRGEEAERLWREAFAMACERMSGPRNQNAQRCVYQNATVIGERLLAMDRPAEAEAIYRRCLEALRLGGAPDHMVAGTLQKVGHALEAKGDLPEAARVYRQAHDLWGFPRNSGNLGNLIRVHGKLADIAAVIPLCKHQVEQRRTAYGDLDPRVADALEILAIVLYATGNPEDGEQRRREAFDVLCQAVAGTIENPEYMSWFQVVWNRLGRGLRNEKRPVEAEAVYRRALESLRAGTGGDRRDGTLVHELGHALADQGKLEDAEGLFREALGSRAEGERAERAHDLQCLVMHLFDQGMWERARPLVDDFVAARRGDKPLQVASALAARGSCLLEAGEAEGAEVSLRECIALREQHGEAAWLLWNTRSLLGEALTAQGKYADAEPVLVQAAEKIDPPERWRERKARALERVVRLYEAWGKPDDAAEWKARLEKEKGR